MVLAFLKDSLITTRFLVWLLSTYPKGYQITQTDKPYEAATSFFYALNSKLSWGINPNQKVRPLISLRIQATLVDAITGFPAKWR